MAAPSWAPASAAVAPHLSQYLRPRGSHQPAEDFTADTVPTKAEVDAAIESVASDLANIIGPPPEELQTQAAAVVAIGAASEVIIDRDLDLHRALQDLYELRLRRLITAADDIRDGTIDGKTSIPATGCFPAPFGVDRTRF